MDAALPNGATSHDFFRRARTRLTLDKLEYNVALKDEDFTLQAIRRQ